jgi:acetolactate synthase I/II/III large subunit
VRLTGGQALARQLVLEGITDVFGIPGVQLDWAVDGLRQLGNQIHYIVPRHEQTTAYMADGYARTTGKIGTCMVVPGPGLLNAMAGLATAYACNSRVLAIVGNIYSGALGKGFGLLHEVRHQSEILGSVTKWHAQARSPKDIPGLVREAVRQLRSGRPQPVGVEIAHDLLAATDDIDLVQPNASEDGRIRPDATAVEQAAAVLAHAKLPVIYVGGGVLAARASAALQALAEKLDAPVVMSENGRGALSDRHPLALTALSGRAVFAHADVALIVGSRFADTTLGAPAWAGDNLKYIWLNVDPQAWTPPRKAAIAIEADAGLGMEALAAALPNAQPPRDLDLDKARSWADEQLHGGAPDLVAWIRALRAAIPDDGIFINELTQVGYLTRSTYPVYGPGTYITPGYQGTLGYGFPTALGAAYGNPGRAVVCITGDGGFGWGMQELATANKYGLKLAIVVFNDGYFGNVKRLQEDQFGGWLGADLHNPHFDRLAAAFDVGYARADTPEELEKVLKRSLGTTALLIEARVGSLSSPWPYIRLRGGKPNEVLPDPRRHVAGARAGS